MLLEPKINPFQIGVPIRDSNLFIGRQNELLTLSTAMLNLKNVSLRGERRTGKTSLLLVLSNPDNKLVSLPENYITVFFDFQMYTQENELVTIWTAILRSIAEAVLARFPSKFELVQELYVKWEEACKNSLFVVGMADALLALNRENLKINLLMDEFDLTTQINCINESFFDALRSLPTRANNLSYVISTRYGISDLQLNYQSANGRQFDKYSSPFFNIFTSLILEPFTENDAKNLINRYLNTSFSNKILLDNSWVKKFFNELPFIYSLTGYHPFFLQLLCYHLFSSINANINDWPEDFEKVVKDKFTADSWEYFNFYWVNSDEDEKRILRKFSNGTTLNDKSKRERRLIRLLKMRSLIIFSEETGWKLFSECFGMWIRNALPNGNRVINKVDETKNKKILHVFTGGKGGVGKTLFSINTTLNLCKEGKTLCIDLNWENADISGLFFGIDGIEEGKIYGDFFYKSLDENLLIARPSQPNNIPSGALGFWRSIENATNGCYRAYQYDPDYIIVDTGLHFASLLRTSSPGTVSRVTDQIDKMVRENNIIQLNLWFIWRLASTAKEEAATMQKIVSFFDQKLGKDYFQSTKNMIHVLNLPALYPPVLTGEIVEIFKKIKEVDALNIDFKDLSTNKTITLNSARVNAFQKIQDLLSLTYNSPSVEINSLKVLSNALVDNSGIAFYDFVNIIQEVWKDSSWNDQGVQKYLLENIGKKILINSDNKRPINVMPIADYRSNLIGLTDLILILRRGLRTLKDLEIAMGPIYSNIQNYLRDYLKP